jgi:plasmid stabilization system protein ParE
MTRRFTLRPRAESDIQSAFEWYESQRPGLGAEFLTAVREKLEAVRNFPESSPVIYRDVRRAVVSRFP